MIKLDDIQLQHLLAWSSPALPTGGFAYSHGLEWAVEDGQVRTQTELIDYVHAMIARGSGWIGAVLFCAAFRAVAEENDARLDEIADLALAFRGSAEFALESRQQGAAFLGVVRRAWPHRRLERFAARRGAVPVDHAVAVALVTAVHGIAVRPALTAYLHALASALVSAGVRLIPLGQTEGQIAVAQLVPVIAEIARRAERADLEEIGGSAPGIDLCSFRHETQYTRLFRS